MSPRGALPAVTPQAVRELYASFRDAHADGASSNDVVQLLDDWFTQQGYQTVIYAQPAAPVRRKRVRRG